MYRYRHLLLTIVIPVVLGGLVYFAINPNQERTETLFIYGTLLNPIVRSVVCHCFVSPAPTSLPGYEKIGRTIITRDDAQVAGAIITVSPWELQQIDTYERIPEKYRREKIRVSNQEVWVYIKN